jgi:hypothetical protein
MLRWEVGEGGGAYLGGRHNRKYTVFIIIDTLIHAEHP